MAAKLELHIYLVGDESINIVSIARAIDTYTMSCNWGKHLSTDLGGVYVSGKIDKAVALISIPRWM